MPGPKRKEGLKWTNEKNKKEKKEKETHLRTEEQEPGPKRKEVKKLERSWRTKKGNKGM